jgi:hypothetical protein
MARKAEKTNLLDEYLRLASGNRKYAIFKLNRVGKTQLRVIDGENVIVKIVEKSRKKHVYKPYYDPETVRSFRTPVPILFFRREKWKRENSTWD